MEPLGEADRFRGCLVGLAVGDCLGGPVEFWSRAEIRAKHGRLTELFGGGWLNLAPGEYTDDTQMMLCIARSIVKKGRFDPDDVAVEFVRWYDTRPKDIGNITRTALAKIKAGRPWREASRDAHDDLGGKSAGNGGVMRCAPVGLLHCRREDRLIEDSLVSAQITHWDTLAGWPCVALNLAIAGAVQGSAKDKLLADVLPKIAEPAVRDALAQVEGLPVGKVRASGYAVHSVQAAFWSFLGTDSFEEAVVTAVNLGEDADTTGAVCGALAGAYYGLAAIPERWVKVLRDREEIVGLADGILKLSQVQCA